MTPAMCRVTHDPEAGKFGDCLRACIASILDVSNPEDVPHFFEDGATGDVGQWRLREYLATLGFGAFYAHYDGSLPRDEVLGMIGEQNPNMHYILCASANGGDHSVVCCNADIVHNPIYYGGGITGPNSDGFWSILVIARL